MHAGGRGTGLVSHHQPSGWGGQWGWRLRAHMCLEPRNGCAAGHLGGSGPRRLAAPHGPNTYVLRMHRPHVCCLCACVQACLPPWAPWVGSKVLFEPPSSPLFWSPASDSAPLPGPQRPSPALVGTWSFVEGCSPFQRCPASLWEPHVVSTVPVFPCIGLQPTSADLTAGEPSTAWPLACGKCRYVTVWRGSGGADLHGRMGSSLRSWPGDLPAGCSPGPRADGLPNMSPWAPPAGGRGLLCGRGWTGSPMLGQCTKPPLPASALTDLAPHSDWPQDPWMDFPILFQIRLSCSPAGAAGSCRRDVWGMLGW